jgi:hypothetical protein
MQPDIEEEILRNYLLGNLLPEEQSQVEERLFLDREYFQSLQVAEDDLIDDYVYEELSTAERERFEAYYLSTPDRYEAVRLARALKSYISNNAQAVAPAVEPAPAPKTSFLTFLQFGNASWPLPLAVATLLIIIGGLALILWSVRTQKSTGAPQEARQPPQPGVNQNSPQQNNEQATGNTNTEPRNKQKQYAGQQNGETVGVDPRQKEKEPLNSGKRDYQVDSSNSQSRQRAARTYAFLLVPGGLTRGEGSGMEVPVPADAGMITLQLPLLEDVSYSRFRAVLYRDDGQAIRSWSNLTSAKAEKVVFVNVPAQLLRQQNYHIKLSGNLPSGSAKEIQTYYFRVVRR